MMLYFLCLGGAALVIGAFGTKFFIKIMSQYDVFAEPNERSMHTERIPTGAGWVIVIVVLIAYILSYSLSDLSGNWFIPLSFFLLALLSWYDDKIELPSIVRFAIQFAIVAITLILYAGERPIIWDYWPLFIDRIIVGFGWLWFINLFNFMDGIDGIVGMEIISIGLGILLISSVVLIPLPNITTIIALIGVTLGFLIYNWHPAKIYLGDTGSIPIGYLLGWFLIQLSQQGYLIAALVIPAYFLADASYTLIRRIHNKENFLEAHRTHLYQKATLVTQKPDMIVLYIAVANFILIIAALLSISKPLFGLFFGGITVFALLLYLKYLGRKN